MTHPVFALHVRNARAAVVLAAIDTDPAPAALWLLSDPPPEVPGDALPPTAHLLAVVTLSQPAGVVAEGVLVLTPADYDTAVLADGTPTWARLVDGAGGWIRDFTAGGPGSSAEVEVTPAQLYAGGRVRAEVVWLIEA